MKQIAGALLLVCSAAGAARADLVNGSFESADFRGWTITKTGASPQAATVGIAARGSLLTTSEPIYDFGDHVANPNYSPGLPMPGSPTSGRFNAVIFQNAASTVRISQAVDLEKGAELSWDLAYHNWAAFSPEQRLRVTLHDSASNELLATLVDTQDAMPVDLPMTHYAFDLSAFAGRRAVLELEVIATTSFLDVQLDDVQLTGQHDRPDSAGQQDASGDDADQAGAGDDVGGCSAGGGGAGLAAAAALTAMRRRRR